MAQNKLLANVHNISRILSTLYVSMEILSPKSTEYARINMSLVKINTQRSVIETNIPFNKILRAHKHTVALTNAEHDKALVFMILALNVNVMFSRIHGNNACRYKPKIAETSNSDIQFNVIPVLRRLSVHNAIFVSPLTTVVVVL